MLFSEEGGYSPAEQFFYLRVCMGYMTSHTRVIVEIRTRHKQSPYEWALLQIRARHAVEAWVASNIAWC
jgi:hypothetical protein